MDSIKLQQNRGYLIAGIGALVALLAFLFFPYANVTLTCFNNCSGVTGYSLSLNATLIAGASATQSQSSSDFFSGSIVPFQGQGTLWLLPLLTLVALALIGLLLYRNVPFGKSINAPVATQKKWGNYALIGIAGLSILVQIVLLLNLGSQFQNYFTATSASTSVAASANGHVGFWLYLLGMAAVAGGVIFMLVQERKQALPSPMPNQQSAQSWQQPYNPYAQQPPVGQYQPPQNPYSTGQYPPTSYPPQAPHPPQQ